MFRSPQALPCPPHTAVSLINYFKLSPLENLLPQAARPASSGKVSQAALVHNTETSCGAWFANSQPDRGSELAPVSPLTGLQASVHSQAANSRSLLASLFPPTPSFPKPPPGSCSPVHCSWRLWAAESGQRHGRRALLFPSAHRGVPAAIALLTSQSILTLGETLPHRPELSCFWVTQGRLDRART